MGKVTKRHVEGRTREQCIAVRKKLGPLQQLTVQSRTKDRYAQARQGFYSFLRQNQVTIPHKREFLDPLVSDYIEFLWSTGEGRSKANDTVAGLQDKDPKIRGHLPASWRLLKTWSLNELPNRAPPFPEKVVQAMAGYAFATGEFNFGLSLLLCFYCILRTGELLGLCSHHISMSSPKKVAIISLGFTKGGQRQGAAESATLGVLPVLQLLWKWKQEQKPNSALCPAPHKWRTMFANTVRKLKLEDHGFRPYSMRRGGATHWFQHHGSFDKLLVQGRWAAAKTAKIYVNEGLALLAEISIPVSTLKPFVNSFTSASR
jgi:hypothetical protein